MGTRISAIKSRLYEEDHPHAYGDKFSLARAIPAFFGIIPTRMGTSSRYSAIVRTS